MSAKQFIKILFIHVDERWLSRFMFILEYKICLYMIRYILMFIHLIYLFVSIIFIHQNDVYSSGWCWLAKLMIIHEIWCLFMRTMLLFMWLRVFMLLVRMAPEVAAVERKGGYNQQCDVWAVGITAIEFAELQPPMFDLHPMRFLFIMNLLLFFPFTSWFSRRYPIQIFNNSTMFWRKGRRWLVWN